MNFDPYNSELCLAHNAPVRLMSARGVRIICTAGSVWLTVEGEAGDVFPRRRRKPSHSRPRPGLAGSHRERARQVPESRQAVP
ncbi:MAG: DUF2917 domain-containing protein [Propionivibrio sp.]|nr:DUF2917 domain-containing protein [Propionivibrio sp.]